MAHTNIIHKALLQAYSGHVHHMRMLSSLKSTVSIHLHSRKHCINLKQPVRYGAKEKQERTRSQMRAERKRRQDARINIPLVVIPHVVKISEILDATGRTAEQVFQAKAKCERVFFVKEKNYPLDETLSHPLLSCVMKTLGYRVDYLNSTSPIISQGKDIYAKQVSKDPSRLKLRPPVVAVMGHVDHGKTTVLDALRNTSIAKAEAGGITQSIGAFSVSLQSNYAVTFLDTPGHSVFTSMRERGAQVADIVLLMVAADDGVMEQTIESINMIKMADTPVVVAINKCDKSGSAPDLVIEDLSNYGIKCEEIGGDVPAVKISALMKKGLDNLVQTLVATAELHSIKCDPNMQTQGFVLESQMHKGLGNQCSVVIKQGTLKVGQILVAGNSMAKVKAIIDTKGKKIKSLHPGEAGTVTGWKSLPSSGQLILQAETEAHAKEALRYRTKELQKLVEDEILEEVIKKRESEKREYENLRAEYATKKQRKAASYRVALAKNKHCESVPRLNILIKADVDGSMEAIMKIINSYDCEDECILNVISHGIGPLKSSEYELAKELKATIFLFNTDIPKSLGDEVDYVKHDVIYHFVKTLKEKLNEILPTVEIDTIKGEGTVLEIFTKRNLVIAGCRVSTGVLDSKDIFTLERDGVELHRGSLQSMRQHATLLSKVASGNECGVVFEDDLECDIQAGDIIRCVTVTQEKQQISWMPHGF